MAPLLTTGQSRWGLHILLALLSAVAIASSAPSSIGGELPVLGHRGYPNIRCFGRLLMIGVSMLSGSPGDIRGAEVLGGAISLGGVIVLYVFGGLDIRWSLRDRDADLRRTAYVLLPRPWRLYLDRVEFAFISMLWISWTCTHFTLVFVHKR